MNINAPMVNQLKHKFRPLELSSIKRRDGVTLVELLVVLAILSILASAALPYAQVMIQREKEMQARSALREIRTAIDRFHDDWRNGKISRANENASEHGFPVNLQVLVEGIEHATVDDTRHKYLRRIPPNPFVDPELEPIEQWQYRSYQDQPDTSVWGGQDVYDIRIDTDKQALDGTYYKNW